MWSAHEEHAWLQQQHVTDEVQIDLDVLGALMLDRILQEINNTYIVTINEDGHVVSVTT
jgi:ABC-type uncharacterized transport system ATPase subunit